MTAKTHRPPRPTPPGPTIVDLAPARVRRKKILNGLINEYSQAA